MEELNPSGKTKTTRQKMLAKRFDFDYFTSIYKTKNDKCYHFCYEYAYLPLDNDELLLVKRGDKSE